MVWTQKDTSYFMVEFLLSYQPDNNMKQQKTLPIPAAIIFTLSLTSQNNCAKSSYYEQKPRAPSAAQIQELMETVQLLCTVTCRSFHTSATKTTPSSYKAGQRRNSLPVSISVCLTQGFMLSPWSLLLREEIVLQFNGRQNFLSK